MSLESINQYLQHLGSRRLLNRLYWSQKLEKAVESEFKLTAKIVIRESRIAIYCSNQTEAASLRLKIGRLRQLLKGYPKLEDHSVAIRTKTTGW